LFLSIRDNTAQTSMVFDLNVNLDDFVPGSAAASTTQVFANADVQNYVLSSSGDISWAVMAGDNTPPSQVDGIRYLTTTNAASISMTNANLQQFTTMTSYLINVNVDLDAATDTATYGSGDAGYFELAMDSWNGNAPFSATAGVNESQNFYMLSNSASLALSFGRAAQVNQEQYLAGGNPGTWTLDSEGVLTYSAVPLPPAVWLLGSALLGLVGVARRKAQNV
ncbi:MAG: VPLPA-CTERM sorting domain-containing protein, partial [Gammaproteobacteria bacterium]